MTGGPYEALSGNDVITNRGKQGTYINLIIDYYKANYDKNTGIVASTADGYVVPKITSPAKLTFGNDSENIIDGYMFIGPFKIESSETGKSTVDYSIDISFKDGNGNSIETDKVTYYLQSEKSTAREKGLPQTKEGLEGKDFYIVLKKGTSIRKIDIKLNSASIVSDSKPTAWTVSNNNDMQPLISVERTETQTNPVEIEYEFEAAFSREHDVSLRKFISTVRRYDAGKEQWSNVYTGSTDRKGTRNV